MTHKEPFASIMLRNPLLGSEQFRGKAAKSVLAQLFFRFYSLSPIGS